VSVLENYLRCLCSKGSSGIKREWYILKKQYQNPLANFKDLSIHTYRRTAGSDFVLYYVYNTRRCSIDGHENFFVACPRASTRPSVGQVRVCNVYNVLDRVNRRDRFSMKKLRSSARGASFHTKDASNANIVRVLLDANSYLAL
jgi:hypothetical protein